MKKILSVAFASLALSACSSASNEQRPQDPQGQPANNPAIEKALQECHQTLGDSKDMSKLDACMKEKGFDKPAAPNEQAAQDNASTEKATAKAKTAKAKVKHKVKSAK